MSIYYRPIAQTDHARPADGKSIAGGWAWFTHAERIKRGEPSKVIPAQAIPPDIQQQISAPRASVAGAGMSVPRLMGILNVTPDSFSDGGQFLRPDAALGQAVHMAAAGADIIDIGGESTRPGADLVPVEDEIARTGPVIAAIRSETHVPISIDTRKAQVAYAALKAGATMINDVSALTYDPALASLAAEAGLPVCIMHAQGDPKTMQTAPHYENVLLDVYDFLSARIAAAEAAGIDRALIVIDPGIGFGKTLEHNLTLLRNLSLFHALGCPIALGASRKRFIGTLGDAPNVAERMPGSIAVTLAAVAQGVQIHRVHDIGPTRQALTLWQAATGTRQTI
ncbi:MAG: dihydropteroate synthase [Paracoccaceae bacterium]